MNSALPTPGEALFSLTTAMQLIKAGDGQTAKIILANLMERFYEAAARERGWHRNKVDGSVITHPAIGGVYQTWRECCEQHDLCSLVGELPGGLERSASELWEKEHPEMSVFACDAGMKSYYRRRVLNGERP